MGTLLLLKGVGWVYVLEGKGWLGLGMGRHVEWIPHGLNVL